MQEGKYPAKLTQYGFLSGEQDAATGQTKPPQFFAKFSFIDETQANQTQTWFGGFKVLQPGKKTSQREITLKTIKALGYTGTAIAQLAAGVQSNLLNMEKEMEIELEYQKDAMGAVKVDDTGAPKFRIKWVNDPENTGFKNQMKPQDAAVVIGGLNLDAEMSNLNSGGSNANAQNNGGYDLNQNANNNVQNNNQNQNFQQNNAQNNNQQNVNQQNVNQQNFQNNNGQNNNVNQNVNQNNGQQNNGAPNFNQQNNGNNQMNNQQMGFDQNGTPPF